MIGRLKFDLNILENEMLDHLPKNLFTSSTTTFLDPCMGGGQFVKAIEDRLRAHGHSDDNIAKRVFGVESNQLRVSYAVNKHRLVGQYVVHENYLEYNEQMKFDCVIGNPPYQHNSKSKGNKLWPKFIVKSMELVMENGYLAMVTPDSWMAGGSNIPGNIGILKDVFRPNTLLYVNVADVGKKYFPNVGLSFSWWIASKTISKILTKMETSWGISTVDINSIDFFPAILHPTMQSIYKKVYSTRSFDVISFDRQNTKNGDAKSEKKTRIHKIKHWILGSDIDNKIQYCYLPYDNSPAISNHKKVVFPLRKFSNFHPYVDMKGISVCQQGFCVFLDKHDTEDGVKSVWHSKLMKFLLFSCFPGNFLKTNIVKSLPYISMKKVWTDQELYEHFGLTQEEIDYIEANTK